MKNSAYENFNETALEALDFAKCQRADGTIYGTKGECAQKGAKEVSGNAAPKKAKGGGLKSKSTEELKKMEKALETKMMDRNLSDEDLPKVVSALAKVAEELGEREFGTKEERADRMAKKAKEFDDLMKKTAREAFGNQPDMNKMLNDAVITKFSESLDYARCQRADGSFYGTGGVCRKGAPAGNKKPASEAQLKKAQARVAEKLKTAKGDEARKLRGQRANIEEAMNKLRYAKKGLGGAQSKLTGADVKRAVGTAD